MWHYLSQNWLIANTIVYKEDWTTKLQESLDKPTFWKDVCRVDYTDTRVLHNPYQNDSTTASLTRGTAFSLSDVTLTDDDVTIDTSKIIAEQIDRGDLAQSGYALQMERAARQGVAINEAVEDAFVGDYASFGVTLDGTDVGGSSGDITLTNTNVDNVLTAIKKKLYANNGGKMFAQYGGFVIWDPTNFELLEQFALANGFATADRALGGGVDGVNGFNFLGLTHYVSNSLVTETSTLHMLAGVKQIYNLGILKSTYGAVNVADGEAGLRSSIIITSRVDYKGKVWNNTQNLLINVPVAA